MKLNELKKQIKKFFDQSKRTNKNYPLLDDAFSFEDLMKGIEIILSKKITMGEVTYNFEKEFAKFLNVKYALMTNSGSSANLLASFALTNPKKKNFLQKGDEFIIQSLCWSTSLWPLIQAGLKPKFIDVNLDTFKFYSNPLQLAKDDKIDNLCAVSRPLISNVGSDSA